MRIVTCEKAGTPSLNFVDMNNRMVGFDVQQHRWCISRSNAPKEMVSDDSIIERLQFVNGAPHTETPLVCFDLVDPQTGDMYVLKLSNTHNGYYCHGFVQ